MQVPFTHRLHPSTAAANFQPDEPPAAHETIPAPATTDMTNLIGLTSRWW